ncbi:hypothetical protein [Lysobacter enzymogenes]|uniref:hypothetical protein n=1 Tax=Lysobacter enzymogenes TaxID=69 RepID=UPI001303F49C|nr:hypothetical protein [Lysobacter enzymogenes]UZW62733.1 hypothetical protein BV903_010760 [Lysobacter enzymogenes]
MSASMQLLVRVEIWSEGQLIRSFVIDHNDGAQRRVLGRQCAYALEGGQKIVTYPEQQS